MSERVTYRVEYVCDGPDCDASVIGAEAHPTHHTHGLPLPSLPDGWIERTEGVTLPDHFCSRACEARKIAVIAPLEPIAFDVNLGGCTCGSGWNPRPCAQHPERFQEHIDEMNRENEADLAAHPEETT